MRLPNTQKTGRVFSSMIMMCFHRYRFNMPFSPLTRLRPRDFPKVGDEEDAFNSYDEDTDEEEKDPGKERRDEGLEEGKDGARGDEERGEENDHTALLQNVTIN